MATAESSSTPTVLREIKARLDLHAGDISNCRAALDTQLKQIADIQAQLDAVLAARSRRREALNVRTPRRTSG